MDKALDTGGHPLFKDSFIKVKSLLDKDPVSLVHCKCWNYSIGMDTFNFSPVWKNNTTLKIKGYDIGFFPLVLQGMAGDFSPLNQESHAFLQ